MYNHLKDVKAIKIIEKMIDRNQLPKEGTFEITSDLLKISYNTYRELFSPRKDYKMKSTEVKLANKIAAINFSKLNLDRQQNEKVEVTRVSYLKNTSKSGFVYVVSNPSFENYFKVGMTINPEKRLKQYQTYDPHRAYRMDRVCFVEDRISVEKQILQKLSVDIVGGEWVSSDKVFKIFETIGVNTKGETDVRSKAN